MERAHPYRIWAIVPVKSFHLGKSRLSGMLTKAERSALSRRLLVHTLRILSAVASIEQVLVVSRDVGALFIARRLGARPVREHGALQLNQAIACAAAAAENCHADGVIIVPADLPLITPENVYTFLEKDHNPPVVVIAPDRHHQGSNALLVHPIGLIRYAFGPGSFQHHCDLAIKAGARLEICDLPCFSLDIDLPDDLQMINQQYKAMRGAR